MKPRREKENLDENTFNEDNSWRSELSGGKYKKAKSDKQGKSDKPGKDVVGPDGNLYYGIVAPQYVTVNGVKTKNRQARAAVWRGDYYRTKAGLTRDDLSKDQRGKIVSKKKQTMMKKGNSWKKYFRGKMAKTFKKKKTGSSTNKHRSNRRRNKSRRRTRRIK
jgi:hypothetical protein